MRKTRSRGTIVTATTGLSDPAERAVAVLTINSERNILEVFYADTEEAARKEATEYWAMLFVRIKVDPILNQLRNNLKELKCPMDL